MCSMIGRFPIGTIGFGRWIVSGLRRVPNPPAMITPFIATAPGRDRERGTTGTPRSGGTRRAARAGAGPARRRASRLRRRPRRGELLDHDAAGPHPPDRPAVPRLQTTHGFMAKIHTKARAEAILRELPSVLGAFVREDVNGHPREVHLLIAPGPEPRLLARDIRDLLEERLGVFVDQ